MKAFGTLVLGIFISIMAHAGGNSEKIHENYGSKKGVMALSFSKDIVDAFDLDFNVAQAMKQFNGDFKKVKVLIITANENGSMTKSIERDLKWHGYKFIDVKDKEWDSEELAIYTDKRKKNFNEIHLLSKGEDSAMLISVYGNFVITDK